MSLQNLGTQIINWKYKTPLKGSTLATMLNGSTDPGLYLSNGNIITYGTGIVNSFAGNAIILNPFDAVFKASATQTVHIQTSSAINLYTETSPSLGLIASSAPYITMSYTYANQVINYIDFDFKSIGQLTAYDIVIGKAVFTGSAVTSIDYTVATYPPIFNPLTNMFLVRSKATLSPNLTTTAGHTYKPLYIDTTTGEILIGV